MVSRICRDIDGVLVLPGDYVSWNGSRRLVVTLSYRTIAFLKTGHSWTDPDNPSAFYDNYERNRLDAGLRLLDERTPHTTTLADWHDRWQDRSTKWISSRAKMRLKSPELAARYEASDLLSRQEDDEAWRSLAIQRARERKTSGVKQRRSSGRSRQRRMPA